MSRYSESQSIERPTIELFEKLGWRVLDCMDEVRTNPIIGRETSAEVVLTSRLRDALKKLNPGRSDEAIEQAIEIITSNRSVLSLERANEGIYKLLKHGVRVTCKDESGNEEPATIEVIDWSNPLNNDFLLTSQLWMQGDMYRRRADLVGFVNGIPLVFIEVKASHKRLRDAFQDNLRDYKNTIPSLFWYNAFIILSNGSESKIGTISSGWEHFSEWKRISNEEEPGVVSLETIVRGTCTPERLLDIVENFSTFTTEFGPLAKIVAKNHQYLGANNAFAAVQHIEKNQGRLGVFWHTQGSGKSFSMAFLSQKVLRRLPGNWTFVIVTDRDALDRQIYKTFAHAGAVTEPEEACHASSVEVLRKMLAQEDHRYIFTLIQKFQSKSGDPHPVLSDRSDIIVITDEAHRTQYDILAQNMRNALPNAAFMGFTGTPLIAGEEKTRQVFGDYVSVYDFQQSLTDRNTVPLYYENRIPEMQLTNEQFDEDMEALLDEVDLDEAQEQKLEREFGRQYHLITREDRLEKVAEDIVTHFMGRGFFGKGMVVSVDKATAVRMYDKVQARWRVYLEGLRKRVGTVEDEERVELSEKIRFMETMDMAVVVSQGQNEVEDFKKKGLDIVPHRKRMLLEKLDDKFKEPSDPLRLVFVCAMWMTGFDAPSCSTIYLDKPMRNHALMQTIARANRVFREKANGLIVDYIGIFTNLQRALLIYAPASTGRGGEMPIRAKDELLGQLREAVEEAIEFCGELGIRLDAMRAASGFELVRLMADAIEAILVSDEMRSEFVMHARRVDILFKAMLPDERVNEFGWIRKTLIILAEKLLSGDPEVDISSIMSKVESLLDQSVAAVEPYKIEDRERVDLSAIDFDALQEKFEQGRKRTEAEKLRRLVKQQLDALIELNHVRVSFAERYQQLIDEYNAGSANVERFFGELKRLATDLNVEERRHIREGLSEEELALFDILTRPDMKLAKREEQKVKKVARNLLARLKGERLVLDWRKRQQSRAGVRVAIEEVLEGLPEKYERRVYSQKCDLVFQHVFEQYAGEGRSVYASV